MGQQKIGEFRVGADVGGTFTDIVFANPEGEVFTRKVTSTPDNYSRAIITGMQEIFSETGLDGSFISEIIHGCTIATNAILEHTGARTGLITTKGFRDVLEIRRFRMPVLYDCDWTKPKTLVDRYLRVEVDERLNFKGEVLRPLDTDSARAAINHLVSNGVESVAVCLLHSYANPIHERQIKELLRQGFPQLNVSLSSELIPLPQEYERTSETVVNAYIKPVVAVYLASLQKSLAEIGAKGPLFVMQSNGIMTTAEVANQKPVNIIECGPAAGVVGCAYLAKTLGIPNALTLDMGGTTAKASVIEGGQFTRAASYEVGAGLSQSSRLTSGGGYVLRVPSIDIAEIGAGGGSILRVDAGGCLHVGPNSAGAVPGPVCYDIGGEDPTLTDANLVLGYLSPDYLVGGALKLNAEKAYKVIDDKVAKPLGMDLLEVAYGANSIANSNMIRAISAVSTERGRDPRNFVLFAFGGAGPIHAVAVARMLNMKRVIIAPNPGLFSAFGLLFADMGHHYVRDFLHLLSESGADHLNRALDSLTEETMASIGKEKAARMEIAVERYGDFRYAGQTMELTIPIPEGPVGSAVIPLLAERFGLEHERTHGFKTLERPIEIVNLRVVAKIPSIKPSLPEIKPKGSNGPSKIYRVRRAYFGPDYGSLETPIWEISDLSHAPRKGPLIIESYDTTVVVPPDCEATLWKSGTISIDTKI